MSARRAAAEAPGVRRFIPVSLCVAAVSASLPLVQAQAVTCKPPTTLLSRTPSVRALPGGATMRTWDTGPTSDAMKSQRIVSVRVPRSSKLRAFVETAGALTRSTTVGSYASRVSSSVVTINGSVFDAAKGAIPIQSVKQNGVPLKGSTLLEGVVAIPPDRKPVMDRVKLAGTAKGRGYTWSVTGLNWGSITGSGINVYTTAWGTAHRPYGAVDVVVAGGKVVARRTGTSRGVAPSSGQVVLTANGTTGTQLSALRVGDAVSVSYRLVSEAGITITDAIGRGRRYLLGSKVDGGTCSSRDEELRPRSAIGWTSNGDLLVVTVSGRAVVNGVMYGGATIHQMPTYLRQLGAVNAVGLDGGGSTTMFVRSTLGASPYRVDRPSTWQRKVPNALTWF
jgi:hypothetical protein